MNIISNNCVGAYTYRMLNTRFENPFMYTLFEAEQFNNLVENYDKLNFSNVKIGCHKNTYLADIMGLSHDRKYFYIIIDDKVTTYFIHHFKSDKYKNLTKIKNNLYYKDIEKYILESYKRRLERMTEDPVFVVATNQMWDIQSINKFMNIKTNYRKLIITKDEIKPKEGTDIVKFSGQWNISNLANTLIKSNFLVNISNYEEF